MDFSNTAKPAPIAAASAPPRSDIVSPQGSVAVELPPEQTVQSAQAGDAVQLDIRARDYDAQARARQDREQAASEKRARQADDNARRSVERRLVIEPRTRSIVLEKKDLETGETVAQLPDETMLKLRIYSRELTERARQAADTTSSSIERRA